MTYLDQVVSYLDQHADENAAIAKSLWENPEIGLQEYHAAQLLAGKLEQASFAVNMGVADMPTAFIAEWQGGKPVIGLLAEYDALPSLSQKVSAQMEPIKSGAPGHGCGHNLFAAGVYGAVMAAKETMEREGINGTLRFYGCPAEETGIGKVFMARAGVFDDLDAAISWHPMPINSVFGGVRPGSTTALANNSFKVKFHGRSAHAAANPQQGRSALKAVQLLDTGVQFMREHITPSARVHSVITNGGGAPNVVPPIAEAWYFVRAPHRTQVDQIYAWVLDIIKGAALMTQTTYEIDFLTGVHELLSNYTLNANLLENMKKVGDLKFTEEEHDFARELVETLPPPMVEGTFKVFSSLLKPGTSLQDIGQYLNEKPLEPNWDSVGDMSGSTDVAEVSFITPTGQIGAAAFPIGVPFHSWQSTACAGSSIGFKAAVYAAKVMALSTLDLFTKPDLLQAAREEFHQSTGGKKYVSPLPPDATPH